MMAVMHNIQPIRNQVLIKLFEGDGVSEGGIIVPGSFKTESNKGVVIAVGSGIKNMPMQFKKGDVVYRVQGHGVPIESDGDKYYLMEQSTILAYA